MTSNPGFYDISADMPGGKTMAMADLKGKVVLVVNVASKCGFTGQYAGLEALYQAHKDQGFVIVGQPCNQFGYQEPGNDDEIAKFCSASYNVTFPILKRNDVNGKNATPLYNFLKSEKGGLFGLSLIKWNFEKFLVSKDGAVIQRYSSRATPETLEKDIIEALEA
ncbi:Glutathione peroxidase 2 [Cystobasidiomycetes sp. EMM_F5]